MKIIDKMGMMKRGTKRVRFTDGKAYELKEAGNVVRVSPLRPWRGKSERRLGVTISECGLRIAE